MIKKGIAPLIVLLVLMTSCADKFNGYQINGQIKGMENEQVILEFLTPTELLQIDTANLDASGKFTMKGNIKEKGFYRLINGEKFWLLLLDNTKVKFEADANDEALKDVKISDFEEGKSFQEAITFLVSKQEAYSAEAQRTQTAMYSPETTDEEKMATQAGFEAFQARTMDEIKEKIEIYMDTNPYSAVYLLSALNPQDDTEFIREAIKVLDPRLPNSVYLNNIKEVLAKIDEQAKQMAIMEEKSKIVSDGALAPDIIMNNTQGVEMKLSDLRGKVVLVDFWASWCKPCRAENPNVVRMYHLYKNQGFDIFSVSLDKTNEAWIDAIAKDGLVWKSHVSDLQFWNNAAAKAWGVSSIPATFLLDKEGKIIAKNLRGAALEAKLKEVL